MCVMKIALFRKTEIPFCFCVLIFFVFFYNRTSRYSICILFVLFHLCSSSLDILSVQEMALLSLGKRCDFLWISLNVYLVKLEYTIICEADSSSILLVTY